MSIRTILHIVLRGKPLNMTCHEGRVSGLLHARHNHSPASGTVDEWMGRPDSAPGRGHHRTADQGLDESRTRNWRQLTDTGIDRPTYFTLLRK